MIAAVHSRRAFLQWLGVAAAGLAGAPLAGCGRRPSPPEDPAAPLGPMERELNVYNWSDYIAAGTIPDFEREFGVKVTYDTYESNEEMVAKLSAGAAGYDIVVPSGYLVPVMLAQGLLAPLHKRHIPNLANVAPLFLDLGYDPGNAHSVPWQWGMTGLAYRSDRVAPPGGWETYFDPRLAGKLTMMDDGREVIGAMLEYRGHSLNSTDPAELAQAKADAIRAKAQLKAYVSAPVKSQLIAGDVWVAQLWNGDARQAAVEQPALRWTLPSQGSLIWTDFMAIPAGAPHKRAAHAFIDYILRPQVGAALSAATHYGSPNAAALPLIADPVPYPDAAQLERLEYQRDLGPATALWDRIWTEIKAG